MQLWFYPLFFNFVILPLYFENEAAVEPKFRLFFFVHLP